VTHQQIKHTQLLFIWPTFLTGHIGLGFSEGNSWQ